MDSQHKVRSIGIIGFGRFGELLAHYLSKDFTVLVSSHSKDAATVAVTGAALASLEETCSCDLVIPAVPISTFEETIKKIAPLVNSNVVVDVCSVKEYPVRIMDNYLAAETGILATHPMFGPDSAGESVAGQKIVLHPVRIVSELYNCIKTYLYENELQIIEVTPEEHDRQIARSQVLTHFIGRGLSMFNAKPIDIDTEGYKRLLHILDVVENDTSQLFHDMNTYNRFAKDARARFARALQNINDDLE